MKRNKPRKRWPAPFTLAEFLKAELPRLIRLYHQLWHSITDLLDLTDYGEPLHLLISNHMAAPLYHALFACHAAIKATKPKDARETELRAALLYDHALRFDGSDNEKRSVLCEAVLAIPTGAKSKVERVGNMERRTIKQGRRQSLASEQGS
jgi:hypothetical protein